MKSPSNIMLIDDDEIFTYIIKKIIEESDIAEHINIFSNGRDAINYLSEVANEVVLLPKVIFLDLNMPLLDGWGFLDEYIRLKPKLCRKINLYVITSSVSHYDHEKSKEYSDITDFIVKPLAKEKFIAIIKKLSNG
ncbi:response regulator [Flavobacterium sp.]|uniref:response regulator n=1 Tax=Flavobacterium sp. TaxID=239 RepID=UPI0025EDEEE3|nr:response regulator [Flavobacterium sp.]